MASTRHNLAAIRSRSDHGDPEASTWELEQNAAALADRLGPYHPQTLIAWGLLAEQLQRTGRDAEALALLDKLIAARTRVLGKNALQTIVTERMRCVSLRRTGKRLRSCAETRRLLERAEAAFGADAAITAALRIEYVAGVNAAQHPLLRHDFDVAGAGCDSCRAALEGSGNPLQSVDCSASFRSDGGDVRVELATCDGCSTVWLRGSHLDPDADPDAGSDLTPGHEIIRPLALLHLEQIAAASGAHSLDLDEVGAAARVAEPVDPDAFHKETPQYLEPTDWGSQRVVVRDLDGPGHFSRLTVSYDRAGDLLLEGLDMGEIVEESFGDYDYEYSKTFRQVDFPVLLAALDADSGDDLLEVIVAEWTGRRSSELESRLGEAGVPIKFWSY